MMNIPNVLELVLKDGFRLAADKRLLSLASPVLSDWISTFPDAREFKVRRHQGNLGHWLLVDPHHPPCTGDVKAC